MKTIAKKEFANGFVALCELPDGKRIETTATCLPLHTEMRGTARTTNTVKDDYNAFTKEHWAEKAMVGVSTQSGCPVKCKFCAVNELTESQGWRNLIADEICEQVEWAIEQVREETGYDMSQAKLFRILLTRMGEPALNRKSVIAAITRLHERYPNARIQVSTIGFGEFSRKLVCELAMLQAKAGEQFIELQFSIHSTSDLYRQWLQHNGVTSNNFLGRLAWDYNDYLRCHDVEVKWKITLNFALTTETPFDIVELQNQFDQKDVFIKVSPINENTVTEKNNIKGLILQTNNI